MTTQELIDYYVALLIIQYATQPNAQATIAAFVAQIIQEQIVAQVGAGFNFAVLPVGPQLDSAIGVQLDDIASYRGAQRVYYGLPPNNFFQMPDAADPIPADGFFGFMDAPTPSDVTWLFLTAEGTKLPIYSLSDDTLYRLTQLRAQVQACDLSIESIDTILQTFFGDNVALIDEENMTIIYVDLNTDTDPLFGIASISGSLPHPAGVLVQAFKADLLTHWFGLQFAESSVDSSFSGFSDAETALTTGTFISAP